MRRGAALWRVGTLLWLALAAAAGPVVAAPGHLPVFPGAQGFGTATPAGRGGRIITVTSLADDGAGSLRAAVEASGPRIIVFEVSGRISLRSDLVLRRPFCTIAGQTAPAPGVMLTGRTLAVQTHDVLVRHLSIRIGDENRRDGSGRSADGIQVTGEDAYNIVFDHVSASWAIDEIVGIGYGARDVTFSNCILAEPLNRSLHPKGPHGYGMLIADGSARITLIGNLLAHAAARMPRIQAASVLLVNNLFYNKGGSVFAALGSKKGQATVLTAVGNLFLDGSGGIPGKAIADVGMVPGSSIHERDNAYPGGVIHRLKPGINVPETNLWIEGIRYLRDPARQVPAAIARQAGARPGDRDAVDRRIIADLLAGRGVIIDSQRQVGGWPLLARNSRPFPVPAEPHGDEDGDGYTNVEEVLHRLAGEIEAEPLVVDQRF